LREVIGQKWNKESTNIDENEPENTARRIPNLVNKSEEYVYEKEINGQVETTMLLYAVK